MTAFAISLFTCSTALETPLPPNFLGSLSLNSNASNSPVEAPLGLAARPTVPSARVTFSIKYLFIVYLQVRLL